MCPLLNLLIGEQVTQIYHQVFDLAKIYKLTDSTMCMFDVVFRNFLVAELDEILCENKDNINNHSGLPVKAIARLDTLFTQALICLRLTMKYNENQLLAVELVPDDDNRALISVYQHLFKRIQQSFQELPEDNYAFSINLEE